MPKRKVILSLCTSLDSNIEGPNCEIDWCFTDQDYSMTAFLERIDTIFFGRISYEQLMQEMPTAFSDKKRVVFSRSMQSHENAVQIINGDIEREVSSLLLEKGKDIWLFGGAKLTSTFLNLNLIDEMMISIHPLILGRGKPLFEEIQDRKGLTLTDTKTFSTGLVQLYYSVDN